MSETTDETVIAGDAPHMSEGTQSAKLENGEEVEFTIPDLLNNMASALTGLLAPHGQRFFVLVLGKPKEDGTMDMNTISSATPDILPDILREQARMIEQQSMVKATTPEEIEAALSNMSITDETKQTAS